MKILVINTIRFCFNGITSVILNYYKQLVNKGYQFDFVINEYIEPDIEQVFLGKGSKLFKMKRNKKTFQYMIQLYQVLKENKYIAVHVHGNSATMAVDLIPALLTGYKVRIAHCHNSKAGHMFFHNLLRPIFKHCYTRALACSSLAGEWIFGKGNYTILPNGIEVNKYRFSEKVREEVRQELGLDGKFVIGHVGLMNEQKNHPKLFGIVESMKSADENVHLFCVTGNGKIPENLARIIQEKGLEKDITVLHQRSDVNRLMQAMDVFVLPSRWEGLPVVLLEAQASGLPCIVSDCVTRESNVCGLVEFIDLHASYQEWCNTIRKVYSQYNDRLQRYDDMYQSLYNIEKCCQLLKEMYLLGA